MQARFYVPWYHKFAAPDPGLDQKFEDSQSWNIYSYVRNQPTVAVDPDGMYLESLLDAASLAAGINNIRKWDQNTSFWGKTLDVAGVAWDGFALAMPIVPGGVGIVRTAGKAVVKEGGERLLREGGEKLAKEAVEKGAEKAAKGGTYKLRDPETGRVRRTGRTNDLDRRQSEHGRHPETKDLDFEVDRRTDSYPAQRGREQRIYEQHPEADLNRRKPISPTNKRRDEYLREGDKL